MLFVAATVFGLYTNTYFALFIGVILAAFIIADVGAALVRRGEGRLRTSITRGGIVAGVYLAALIPQAIVSVVERSKIDGLLEGTRSPNDSYVYGARWWEWIVPSESNPLFKEWTGPFRLARLHFSNAGETNIYLGLTVIALALLGAVIAWLARRRTTGPGWIAVFAGSLVIVGFITSLPSHVPVLGHDIPMPSAALYHVVEPWRVYARLFAVVAIGVAMLAAFGVAWLMSRVPRVTWPVVAAVLAALIAVDLAAQHTHFSSTPAPIYQLLAKQGDHAPRVEYPLVAPTIGRHLAYIFFTEGAKHPLMNGARAGTVESSLQTGLLQDPSRSERGPGARGPRREVGDRSRRRLRRPAAGRRVPPGGPVDHGQPLPRGREARRRHRRSQRRLRRRRGGGRWGQHPVDAGQARVADRAQSGDAAR